VQFLPILALGVLMYLLLVRPQQRRVREQRELVRNVGVGARIQTIGGMIGEVVGAEEDLIHVEVGPGVVITFVRAAVGRIIEQPPVEDSDGDLTIPDTLPPAEDLSGPAEPVPPTEADGGAEPPAEDGPEAGPIGGVAS
jgi:preprotein translocase subunit YajC